MFDDNYMALIGIVGSLSILAAKTDKQRKQMQQLREELEANPFTIDRKIAEEENNKFTELLNDMKKNIKKGQEELRKGTEGMKMAYQVAIDDSMWVHLDD